MVAKEIVPARSDAYLGRFSVDEFLRLVDQRIGGKLSLHFVANHLNLSKAAFTKRFRELVGVSFHRYVLLRRIDIAKQLLRDTAYALSFIGEETGFSSPSHFSSVFVAISGATPGQYREQMLHGTHRAPTRSGSLHISCPTCGQQSTFDHG